jgi:glutamine phosphoribosylpyrophosphate amidotransferase
MYGFLKAGDRNGFCAACFTGHYPVAATEAGRPKQLVLFEAGDR